MRIVANDKYIARRARVGKVGVYAGFFLLAANVVLLWGVNSWSGLIWVVGMVATTSAILLFFAGSYYSDHFSGESAYYMRVRQFLKRLDIQYTLFQYVLPAPHVLLGPDGLTVLVIRPQSGDVSYANGKWRHRQRRKLFRLMAGQEGLGLPEVAVEQQVERVAQYIEKRLPGVDVPLRGVVLFVSEQVNLDVHDPPVAVFYVRDVRSWLRGAGMRAALPEAVLQQVRERLTGAGEQRSGGAEE